MHPIYKILSFEIVGPYTLSLNFDDGTSRIVNFKNILKGRLFGKLNDINFFNQVNLDKEINTIVWPNGADFDPATLHDWQLYEKEFKRMVNKWN